MKGNLSMKFYSYDYVLSQISQQNWVMVAITAGLILVTGVFAFKAFKERHDTKFRELSIISILTLVAVVLITISNFQSNQTMTNLEHLFTLSRLCLKISTLIRVKFMSILLLLQMMLSSKLETNTIVPSQVQNLTATC